LYSNCFNIQKNADIVEFWSQIYSRSIEGKIDPQGEMDGMFETCHLASYEKTKAPLSIGFKVQRFPQLCNLIPCHLASNFAKETGADKFCRTFSECSHVLAMLHAQFCPSQILKPPLKIEICRSACN